MPTACRDVRELDRRKSSLSSVGPRFWTHRLLVTQKKEEREIHRWHSADNISLGANVWALCMLDSKNVICHVTKQSKAAKKHAGKYVCAPPHNHGIPPPPCHSRAWHQRQKSLTYNSLAATHPPQLWRLLSLFAMFWLLFCSFRTWAPKWPQPEICMQTCVISNAKCKCSTTLQQFFHQLIYFLLIDVKLLLHPAKVIS